MSQPCGSRSRFARVFSTLAAALVMLAISVSGGEAWAINFFATTTTPPKTLDPNGLYPLGKKFAIGLYTVVGNSKVDPRMTNMRRAAQAGFNMAGPYYDANWRDFSNIYAAAKEGMAFTYQIRNPANLIGVSVDERAKAF